MTITTYPPEKPHHCDAYRKNRARRMVKDAFTCQVCGRERAYWLLTVHHKKPVSAGGGCRVSNLQTVCTDCHNQIHEAPVLAY